MCAHGGGGGVGGSEWVWCMCIHACMHVYVCMSVHVLFKTDAYRSVFNAKSCNFYNVTNIKEYK